MRVLCVFREQKGKMHTDSVKQKDLREALSFLPG